MNAFQAFVIRLPYRAFAAAILFMVTFNATAAPWTAEELMAGPGSPYNVLKNRVSTNEKWLVFANDSSNRLYSVNLETRQQYDLTAGIPEVVPGQKIRDFKIAPDNVHVAFSLAGLLYSSKLNGMERRLITAELQLDDESGNTKHVFEITRKGLLVFMTQSRVHIVRIDGKAEVEWDQWMVFGSPRLLRVSPSGDKIIVTSSLEGSFSSEVIYLITPATGEVFYIVLSFPGYIPAGGMHDIQISPDGKKVVASADLMLVSEPDTNPVLARSLLSGVIESRFLVPLNLEDNSGGILDPGFAITPDSKHILYKLNDPATPWWFSRLKTIPIHGGQSKRIPAGVDYTNILSWQAIAGAAPRVVSKIRLANGAVRYHSSFYDGNGAISLGSPVDEALNLFPFRIDQISETTGRLLYLTTNTQNQIRITSADIITGQTASFGPTAEFDMFAGAAPDSPWVYFVEVINAEYVNRDIVLRRVHAITGVKETVKTLNYPSSPVLLNALILKRNSVIFADYLQSGDFSETAYLLLRPANGIELQEYADYP